MKRRYGLESIFYSRRVFILKISLIAAGAIVLFLLCFFLVRLVGNKFFNTDSVSYLYDNWDLRTIEGYSNVYDSSARMLDEDPFHNTALTFHGYSSFMLAESETDPTKSQSYLDEAIVCLRNSLKDCKKDSLAQIQYMLGRSYFYKNKLSSYHYYSDLVIKYLNLALENGYSSDDIPLLLGLSYASIGDTDKSIAAFTEALLVRENDTLLFNIAKQYFNNQQESVAKQYLFRVIETSSNEDLVNSSHILLGQIFTEEGNYDEAEKEFDSILLVHDNNADAHYAKGLLYEKKGDSVKARAEWRKCLKIQSRHAGALKKIER